MCKVTNCANRSPGAQCMKIQSKVIVEKKETKGEIPSCKLTVA